MGLRRPVPDPDGPGRPAPGARPARGLRRPALVGPYGVALALPAQRPAALDRGLPADPALARRRVLRGDGRRPAGVVARGGGAASAANGGDLGRAHAASDPGE